MANEVTIVVGMGEVGGPLYDILQKRYECVGVDLEPVDVTAPCSVLHLCIPFQIADFVGTAADYIAKYKPRLTIINSTVAPGTTQAVAAWSGSRVAYSPVRGKHARMHSEMMRYRKFVGADDPAARDAALDHFSGAGFKTAAFPNAAVGEVSKLLETTWLGVLVGWAQEAERIAGECGGTYEQVNAFIQEIDFLPHHITPGVIGGHCVMPNIEILRSIYRSPHLDAIVRSNERKKQKEQAAEPVEVHQ